MSEARKRFKMKAGERKFMKFPEEIGRDLTGVRP